MRSTRIAPVFKGARGASDKFGIQLLPYWLLFGLVAIGALVEGEPKDGRNTPLLLGFVAVLLAVLIGFRYHVGSDWFPYQRMYDVAGRVDLQTIFSREDPGYHLLNWLAQQAGLRLWAVNLACGAIFSWGLLRFSRQQPLPWLAFLVAIPYLGIVVAMGYSRQGVAIGIILAGLAAVQRGASSLRFAIYVAIAALFHQTAIVVIILVIFSGTRTRALNIIAALAIALLSYNLFLAQSIDRLFGGYLQSELTSQGTAIRVALVCGPAILFLLQRRRFAFPPQEDRIWRNFSLAAVAALAGFFILSSSTAVDRVALYLLPLEIVILSRIPVAYGFPILSRAGIIMLCGLIQFVWLNFAAHAQDWIPYRFFPLWT